MTNKWYFYNEKEVVELIPCANHSIWLCAIGGGGYKQINSHEEQSRLFDTKKECIEYAISVISSKRILLESLENKLYQDLLVVLGENE